MIKLISSDMDGTLLDSYRQITQVNIDAIRTLQAVSYTHLLLLPLTTVYIAYILYIYS